MTAPRPAYHLRSANLLSGADMGQEAEGMSTTETHAGDCRSKSTRQRHPTWTRTQCILERTWDEEQKGLHRPGSNKQVTAGASRRDEANPSSDKTNCVLERTQDGADMGRSEEANIPSDGLAQDQRPRAESLSSSFKHKVEHIVSARGSNSRCIQAKCKADMGRCV